MGGKQPPPMVIFSYQRLPAAISEKFPKDWALGRSETGWMNGETFFDSEWKGAEKRLSLFEFWKKHSDIIGTRTTKTENEVIIDLSDAEILEGYDYDQLINSIALKGANSIETSTIVCDEESNQLYENESEIVVTSLSIEVNSPETSTIVCDKEDNQL